MKHKKILSCALAAMMAMQSSGVVFAGENNLASNLSSLECNDQELLDRLIETVAKRHNFKSETELEYYKNQIKNFVTMNANGNKENTVSIANWIVADGIDVAIGFVTGEFGTAAIKAFILEKGEEAARRIFYKTIMDRLLAWGAKGMATSVGLFVDFIFTALAPGQEIAEWLDAHDCCPNNGSWEIWE